MFNGEHLEHQESHVQYMALPEAIDKPPPLAELILHGDIQYTFSLYNVMTFSKTTFMPCCRNEAFIVPNPFGTVKSWTNCPSNCSTKIHPENKLIKFTKHCGTKAHLPCVRIFVFIFQMPWISSVTFSNRKLFTDKSPLSYQRQSNFSNK